MSSTCKATLAVVALAGVIFAYLSAQRLSEWSAQTSPFQSLDEMKATGNIEVRSFKEWQRSHKGEGLAFQRWRERLQLEQGEGRPQAEPALEVTAPAAAATTP